MKIGELVKKSRRTNGITIAELSKRAKMNSDRLSAIEKGEDDPTEEEAEKIAKALGTTAQKLKHYAMNNMFWWNWNIK